MKKLSKDLTEICRRVRNSILENSYKVQACHIGSALSCVEILVDVYWNRLKKIQYENYYDIEDVFIFSKASGASALYSVLAEFGIIPHDKIAYYLKNYPLPTRDVPGVVASVGSLGHGLPIAAGLAFAKGDRDIYVLISDGELQEGTTYETILFAKQHDLSNLHIIVDKNGLQACGRTKDIIDVDDALFALKQIFPIEVIETIKGKGVDWMENKVESHYCNITKEQLEKCKI